MPPSCASSSGRIDREREFALFPAVHVGTSAVAFTGSGRSDDEEHLPTATSAPELIAGFLSVPGQELGAVFSRVDRDAACVLSVLVIPRVRR